ncbi:hypothetical protein [Kineococcus rubinsiae]|uniref:hypothetical protein n=1 Tax=Kineococcus rubinsiae TaxID=2609562 RepID=UPI0027E3B629|nr:hypothetical protein [Kineococcus rubinsiae]
MAVLVDGAHVPALVADPLAGVACDVWVGNLHKFACAPRGAAVLVARGPLARQLHPLIDSWGFDQPFPHRFDHQGTLDESSYLAAPVALEFVEQTWGWESLRRSLAELAEFGAATVAAAFSERTGEDHRPAVGMPVGPQQLVRLPAPFGRGGHAEAGVLRDRVLAELGVETAITAFDGTAYLRVSAHAYNTPDDYEDFAQRCVPVLLDWATA